MAELKFCIQAQMVKIYHWWKFQLKSSIGSRVPVGGLCVFYRPVCKVPNTTGTNFFRSSITFLSQISLQMQVWTKIIQPIAQYMILAKFTFWSVKYQLDRWPNWNFANHLRLSWLTTGQNFKFLALVNLEIFFLGGGLEAPPRCFPYYKNRKMHEGLRE